MHVSVRFDWLHYRSCRLFGIGGSQSVVLLIRRARFDLFSRIDNIDYYDSFAFTSIRYISPLCIHGLKLLSTKWLSTRCPSCCVPRQARCSSVRASSRRTETSHRLASTYIGLSTLPTPPSLHPTVTFQKSFGVSSEISFGESFARKVSQCIFEFGTFLVAQVWAQRVRSVNPEMTNFLLAEYYDQSGSSVRERSHSARSKQCQVFVVAVRIHLQLTRTILCKFLECVCFVCRTQVVHKNVWDLAAGRMSLCG